MNVAAIEYKYMLIFLYISVTDRWNAYVYISKFQKTNSRLRR